MFYRFDEDGAVHTAIEGVYFPDGTAILAECKDEHQYPYQGWEWFDSEEEAYSAHNLSIPQKDVGRNP